MFVVLVVVVIVVERPLQFIVAIHWADEHPVRMSITFDFVTDVVEIFFELDNLRVSVHLVLSFRETKKAHRIDELNIFQVEYRVIDGLVIQLEYRRESLLEVG